MSGTVGASGREPPFYPVRAFDITPRSRLSASWSRNRYADASGVAALEADSQVEKVLEAPELSLIRPVSARVVKLTAGTSWGI